MGIELSASDFGDFIAVGENRKDATSGISEHRSDFAIPGGKLSFKEQILSAKMSILEAQYNMEDDVKIFGIGESSLLEIQINLSAKDIFYQNKSKKEQKTPARSANIQFLSAEDNQAAIYFQKDTSYHTFDVHLPLSLLDRYAGESRLVDDFLLNIHTDASALLSPKNLTISSGIYNVIRDIKTCTYGGLTRKIYLESKVYELIALLYEQSENRKQEFLLTPADEEKIHWVAHVIRDNLEKPLTILELARLVGINQTKLKAGFKSVFNNTVFGYLQEIRMHQAKKYLLDTKLSIQEIGMLLGYQSTSNFSAAFKKTQGYSPMKLREKQV